jgi:hypothetical protein
LLKTGGFGAPQTVASFFSTRSITPGSSSGTWQIIASCASSRSTSSNFFAHHANCRFSGWSVMSSCSLREIPSPPGHHPDSTGCCGATWSKSRYHPGDSRTLRDVKIPRSLIFRRLSRVKTVVSAARTPFD